jgi:hypothetical protein
MRKEGRNNAVKGGKRVLKEGSGGEWEKEERGREGDEEIKGE